MHGEVVEVVRLAPRLVRVVLGGDGLDGFASTPYTDQYVNALFVPSGAPYTVPFDLDAVRALPAELRPVGRRYTIRSWDPVDRLVAIDFVVHGDTGVAGRWAHNATPGDRLQFVGPTGAYVPDTTADWHLMVGDESALPAIAASLERVPAGIPARAVLVVDGPADEIPLDCPGRLEVMWVHRDSEPGNHELLPRAVGALELPIGRVHAFVHGEASEVRAVRTLLLGGRGIPREWTSISPYWRRDFTDESWREVKSAWLAEVEADVLTDSDALPN